MSNAPKHLVFQYYDMNNANSFCLYIFVLLFYNFINYKITKGHSSTGTLLSSSGEKQGWGGGMGMSNNETCK